MDKFNRSLLCVNAVLLVFCVGIISINGCDGGSGSSTEPLSSTGQLVVKAGNVIFRGNSSAFAKEVISEEQVYADNVILDKTNTTLNSDNVQAAFEETNPVLSDIIIGTWDVTSFNEADGGDPSISTGTITFYEDGSFESTGSMEMFGWNYSDTFINSYTPNNYQILANNIISLAYDSTDEYSMSACLVTGLDKITPPPEADKG